mmetsp:Transcript_20527/g.40341  ORF Transcript_20527/g.40341 Transcript_20527/m.40341 type:complete len:103 (+) Transcript_20527:518-826(+)
MHYQNLKSRRSTSPCSLKSSQVKQTRDANSYPRSLDARWLAGWLAGLRSLVIVGIEHESFLHGPAKVYPIGTLRRTVVVKVAFPSRARAALANCKSDVLDFR